MGLRKDKEQILAKELYLAGTKTQKEIAEMVGVTEKTLSNWVDAGNWETIRAARMSTVAEVATNVIAIQKARTAEILASIQAGGDTNKYGDELLKMAMALEKLQGHTTLTTYIQVLQEFMGFVGGKDHKFRAQLAEMQSAFLNQKAGTNG